jgi:hypothetical protein
MGLAAFMMELLLFFFIIVKRSVRMASISGTIKSGWCLATIFLMRHHPACLLLQIMGDLHAGAFS